MKSYGPVTSLRVRKIWQTLSSIKTGVVLIILVVIFSAAGTVILQRPMTDPDDMQRAYSPAMLRFLDAAGLTDVFHARWFVALLILVSLQHHRSVGGAIPQRMALFRASLQEPRRGLPQSSPHTGADCHHR